VKLAEPTGAAVIVVPRLLYPVALALKPKDPAAAAWYVYVKFVCVYELSKPTLTGTGPVKSVAEAPPNWPSADPNTPLASPCPEFVTLTTTVNTCPVDTCAGSTGKLSTCRFACGKMLALPSGVQPAVTVAPVLLSSPFAAPEKLIDPGRFAWNTYVKLALTLPARLATSAGLGPLCKVARFAGTTASALADTPCAADSPRFLTVITAVKYCPVPMFGCRLTMLVTASCAGAWIVTSELLLCAPESITAPVYWSVAWALP